MTLLFARHGNTFEAGEVARIVGAHEDLPLTEAGKEQARVLGRAIKQSGLELQLICAGPLSRTKVFAEIAAAEADFKGVLRIDTQLRELDFGIWSGLSDEEVAARFGQDVLDDWRRHGKRPAAAGWSPEESATRTALSALAEEIGNKPDALCVTSNGVLRYAMELDPTAFALRGKDGGFRVKTGKLCAFRRTAEGLRIAFWDETPSAELLSQLKDQV
jgi:broad specificity phosphatase PhoE